MTSVDIVVKQRMRDMGRYVEVIGDLPRFHLRHLSTTVVEKSETIIRRQDPNNYSYTETRALSVPDQCQIYCCLHFYYYWRSQSTSIIIAELLNPNPGSTPSWHLNKIPTMDISVSKRTSMTHQTHRYISHSFTQCLSY